MATDPRTYIGKVFAGRYQIERHIGEGGMGAVFEATQTSLGRKVAIKVVKSTLEGDDETMKRFQREAEAVARLQHPHIVTVVDAGRAEDGTLFLAMELLTGETVRAALKREHHFPWPRALAVVEDVAAALMAAHEAGVIHRDLKAENVMLTRAAGRPEHAKVLDFGVAKLTAQTQAPPVTGSGFVAGTPGCIAPEQMLGKADDPRSDLYSVGVLLFEMLAGRAPIVGGTGVELMMRHLTETMPRVGEVCRAQGIDVPAAVDELCAALLSKDPDERPPSAAALVQIAHSLRESAMATMPSIRTPSSGTTLPLAHDQPTGDDDVLPAVRLASSAASEAPTRATPLSMSVPTPGSPPVSPRRRRGVQLAAAIVGVGLVVALGVVLSTQRANRLATNDDGERAVQKAIDAVWQADTPLAEREAARALRVDPGASGAAVIRAFVAVADGAPLSRYDQRIGEARAIAREVAGVAPSHTLAMIDRLSSYDLEAAQRDMREHSAICTDRLEAAISAERFTHFEVRPAVIRELFGLVKEPTRPIVRLGLVRADLAEGTPESLAHARELLDALEREVPPTALTVRARVQLALAEGKVDEAIARLQQWTQQSGDDLDARRRLITLLARGTARATRDAAIDARIAEQLEALTRRVRELEAAGGERAVDEMSALADTLAVLGRMREATALWQRALELSGGDHRRNVEIAALAALLSRLQSDRATAQSWSDLIIREARSLPEGDAGRERTELVWHALQVMKVADQQAPDVDAVRGSAKLLGQSGKDVPMLVDTARWYFAVAEGDLGEARRIAEAMSDCMRPNHLARLAFVEAEMAADDAARADKLRSAALALEAATTDALRLRCTLDNDAPAQATALAFGELLLRQAGVALAMKAPNARELIERAGVYWAGADDGGRPQLALADLRRALAASPAAP